MAENHAPIGFPVKSLENTTVAGPAASEGIHASFLVEQGSFTLDLKLDLPGRGVTAIFGHSGSGKTTLLRCLAGLARPKHGRLCVNGDIWLDTANGVFMPTHKRPLGYVFQEASLFPHLTVTGNLRYGLDRVAPASRRVDLSKAAELLGISHLLQRMPAGLSGGERQRVAIARALLTSPRILLLDEPLASLDQKRKLEILPYLERLHDELDIPVLYVSHAPEEVARLADHLVLLDNGRAIASGPIADTLARLDLPLAMADDASVIIQGVVAGYEPNYELLTLQLPGNHLSLRVVHSPLVEGKPMRLVIRARDVSLALSAPEQSSVLNVLPATVVEIVTAVNPSQVMVRLDVAGTPLLSRITRYSHDHLQLGVGKRLWAQVKAVSLLV
ncbi:molybdenum ABC transporter ATP-binding protein [Paraburkholderia dinghuensis]|uniref:Molybdenum ABC transporter ATP-binding protein n=1 Tax=Paraburkholderia dinghuensis TaxID=2305225 RepID=A0A3N6PXL3_9BURK|nr:molybdenum ABC transporter ATP-binding protein [Paraburkholderia dinghuensis]RQH07130.1 molybdenum ABC transporter ATP-binding protein [Paraburkholderia dinghuensis]